MAGETLLLGDDGDITEAGDLARGQVAIRQHVRVRCLKIEGEWFLDVDPDGVPYFSKVFVKNPDAAAVAAVFRTVIEETPGVRAVLACSLTYDRETRIGRLTFRASTDEGELEDAFTVGGGQPQ